MRLRDPERWAGRYLALVHRTPSGACAEAIVAWALAWAAPRRHPFGG